MAFQHSRRPDKLTDDVYGEFGVKVTQFLAEDNSLPHRPTQFVAEQIVRADAYIAALDEFRVAETNMKNSSAVVKAAVDGISAKILWFKYILPTLIIGPDTLVAEFGLDGELPEEYAKIKNLGDEVAAHWEARKLEPIFAPILADGDLLAGLLASYDSAVAAQNTAQNNYHTKSVAKNEARDSHHELEREIFNWFRAHYTDPYDDYWVKTPWGKASGGSGGGGQPEPEPEEFPAWPGPTGKFTLKYWGDGVVEIVYGGVQESTIGWLHRSVPGAEDWIEVNKHLPMNEEDILPFREMHVPIGMWEYRFIPMRGVEKGVASFALIEVV